MKNIAVPQEGNFMETPVLGCELFVFLVCYIVRVFTFFSFRRGRVVFWFGTDVR